MEDIRPGPPLRLSELAASVSTAVAKAFGQQRYWVIADVTNHTNKTDTHYHYFDLVEKDPHSHAMVAKFAAKAWGAGAQSIAQFQQITGQKFTNNINVLVNVSVQFHAIYGLQLNLNEIDPNFTLGLLELQRRATLQRLLDENPEFIRKVGDTYLTRNKELPLPRVLQRLAVVSSRTSAGWQDFKHKLEENVYGYRFFVDDYFTVVQGEANVQQLVDRLVDVFRSAKPYDAVVIIRGGGSQTDFLIFEHYLIGKAIAKFPIPVITGIGHHKNESIADLMAHKAVKTPSEAAEFIVNHNHAFENAVATFQKNIVIRSQQRFSNGYQLIGHLNSLIVNKTRSVLIHRNRELLSIATTVTTSPRVVVYNKLNDLKQIVSNLQTFNAMYLKNQLGYLGHLVSVIRLVSPENTLKRGFALIKAGDRVTSDPDQIAIGLDIEILLRDKSITSTVKSKQDAHGNDFNL
jgi:exodeoxyribonuclease VII large subunit